MKEYLRRNAGGTYSYVGVVHPDHVHDLLIEIPDGAIKAYLNNSKTINFVNSDDDYMNHVTKGEWVGTHRGMHEKCGHVLVWSRSTIPEELPFVDDEPSLNDQYAEIEKVRKEAQAWANRPEGCWVKRKPNQATINAMNEADTLFADAVNHPSHYAGEIECIDAIESSMTHEAFCGYLKGNVQKYMWRYENKGGITDLEKAQWYLNKLISRIS